MYVSLSNNDTINSCVEKTVPSGPVPLTLVDVRVSSPTVYSHRDYQQQGRKETYTKAHNNQITQNQR